MKLYLIINEIQNKIYVVASNTENAIKIYQENYKEYNEIVEIKCIASNVIIGE